MSIVAGMKDLEAFNIIQILLCQIKRILIDDPTFVAGDKLPVSVDQTDLGVAVFPVILAAAGVIHSQLIQRTDNMVRHRIPAKNPHIGGAGAKHLRVHGEIHGLPAGVHDHGRIILIAYIVSNADYL